MYTIYFNISGVSVLCVLTAFPLLFFQLTPSKYTGKKNLEVLTILSLLTSLSPSYPVSVSLYSPLSLPSSTPPPPYSLPLLSVTISRALSPGLQTLFLWEKVIFSITFFKLLPCRHPTSSSHPAPPTAS